MLKSWLASGGDLGSIDVEERYESWVSSLRTDRYVTVWDWGTYPAFHSWLHVHMWRLISLSFKKSSWCQKTDPLKSCIFIRLLKVDHEIGSASGADLDGKPHWELSGFPFFTRDSKVTEMQLEKIYGKSKESREFIATLIAGQRGTPHPTPRPVLGCFLPPLLNLPLLVPWQAPNLKKARLYKVLREVVHEDSQGTGSKTRASQS